MTRRLLFVGWLLVLGCAQRHQGLATVKVEDPSARVQHRGFSTLPPQGIGWRVHKDAHVALYFRGNGERATAENWPVLDPSEATPDGLVAVVRRSLWSSVEANALRGSAVEVRPDRVAESTCARYEQRAHKLEKGVLLPVFVRGLRCVHPGFPEFAVQLEYRSEGGVAQSAAEIDAFLESLAFTADRPVAVQTRQIPGGPNRLAAGAGGIWATLQLDGAVARFDPDSLAETCRASLAGALHVAASGELIWTGTMSGRIARVDPASCRLSAGQTLGEQITSMEVTSTDLWVGHPYEVLRLDPRTGAEKSRHQVPCASDVEALGGELWIACAPKASVSRLRPDADPPVTEFSLGAFPGSIASDGQQLWLVAPGESQLMRVDPENGSVALRAQVPRAPFRVVAGGGRIWMAHLVEADGGEPTLTVVDPITGALSKIGGNAPRELVLHGGALYFSNANSTLERIRR